MNRRTEIPGIPFEISKLTGFVPLLFLNTRNAHHKTVNINIRIRFSFPGRARFVHELCPNQVDGSAIGFRPMPIEQACEPPFGK